MTAFSPPTPAALPEPCVTPDFPPALPHSAVLAEELNRITTTEQAERDRRQQEEIARLRELARYD